MKKQLEQYFGCKVKIAEYKNKLPLPIFMTMREITMVEIYGVNFAIIDVMKETELSVAAMKKQKAKYEEALQCPVAYEVALNSVSMRNALVKSGVPFVDLPGNVFLPFMGIVLQDVYAVYRQCSDQRCIVVPDDEDVGEIEISKNPQSFALALRIFFVKRQKIFSHYKVCDMIS